MLTEEEKKFIENYIELRIPLIDIGILTHDEIKIMKILVKVLNNYENNN